jgi:hypothetical protein
MSSSTPAILEVQRTTNILKYIPGIREADKISLFSVQLSPVSGKYDTIKKECETGND